ncbi:hypothetical protein [Thioclava indica]|uniref:hypothetical protein n=1 Tax=Thioclava indica TaxID=1353528 RepID=UPI000689BD4C
MITFDKFYIDGVWVAPDSTAEIGAPATMAREVQADAGIGHPEEFIAALEALGEQETPPNGDSLSREPIGV